MTIVLGIDPGFAQTGYGIIQAHGSKISHVTHGAISTAPDLGTGKRLQKIHAEICRIVDQYSPTVGGIETLYFAKNITSAFPVAQARGVALLALAQADVVIREFPPQEIKQAITGNGRAQKKQVQDLVRFLLSLEEIPQPDHAADALATAICCYHSVNAEALIHQQTGGIG
jgi:crossover junction endodeoxyribonuclease RuvC